MKIIKLSMEKNKLFKEALSENAREYNNRPEFIYRIHRWKFTNLKRIPFSLSTFYHCNGWVLKGFFLYSSFYILFRSKPEVPKWNREGFDGYDSGHHAFKSSPIGII